MRLLDKYADRLKKPYFIYLVYSGLMILLFFVSRPLFDIFSLVFFIYMFYKSGERVRLWVRG